MLYRALTRSQMFVVVVNAYFPGGLFEYLGHIRLEEECFSKEKEVLRCDAGAIDKVIRRGGAREGEAEEGQVQDFQGEEDANEEGGGGNGGGEVGVGAPVAQTKDEAPAAAAHSPVLSVVVGQSIWDTGENEKSSNPAPAFMPFRKALWEIAGPLVCRASGRSKLTVRPPVHRTTHEAVFILAGTSGTTPAAAAVHIQHSCVLAKTPTCWSFRHMTHVDLRVWHMRAPHTGQSDRGHCRQMPWHEEPQC